MVTEGQGCDDPSNKEAAKPAATQLKQGDDEEPEDDWDQSMNILKLGGCSICHNIGILNSKCYARGQDGWPEQPFDVPIDTYQEAVQWVSEREVHQCKKEKTCC